MAFDGEAERCCSSRAHRAGDLLHPWPEGHDRCRSRRTVRFPTDFMFQLIRAEAASLRSQLVILERGRGKHRKYLPYAFTQEGVAMTGRAREEIRRSIQSRLRCHSATHVATSRRAPHDRLSRTGLRGQRGPTTASRIERELHPGGYNLGVNVGPAPGQTVGHVHIHRTPRSAGDVDDPRSGIHWIIPTKARYWEGRDHVDC